MDTLTHALSGALLARATTPRGEVPGRRVAAGFLACAAPDLDFLWASGSTMDYLLHHRGITHSLVLLPLWALGLAWLLAKALRAPGGWRALYGVCAASLAMHIAGDLITSFGTMILAPFSDWRAAIGTTFIIDLWFSGIIAAGLLVSFAFKSRYAAIAALAVLAAYVGFQYVLKEQALEFARAHALAHGLKQVRAEPRPVSPFNWAVFASDDEKHDMANVNLVRRVPKAWHPGEGFIARLDAPYLPLDAALWVTRYRYGSGADAAPAREAWRSPALAFFRWFAALPAFDGAEAGCYYFVDLRFATPGRGPTPFRFGACRRGDEWRLANP